jgi:hypothetical protein
VLSPLALTYPRVGAVRASRHRDEVSLALAHELAHAGEYVAVLAHHLQRDVLARLEEVRALEVAAHVLGRGGSGGWWVRGAGGVVRRGGLGGPGHHETGRSVVQIPTAPGLRFSNESLGISLLTAEVYTKQ